MPILYFDGYHSLDHTFLTGNILHYHPLNVFISLTLEKSGGKVLKISSLCFHVNSSMLIAWMYVVVTFKNHIWISNLCHWEMYLYVYIPDTAYFRVQCLSSWRLPVILLQMLGIIYVTNWYWSATQNVLMWRIFYIKIKHSISSIYLYKIWV